MSAMPPDKIVQGSQLLLKPPVCAPCIARNLDIDETAVSPVSADEAIYVRMSISAATATQR
jgi:hypothetical protein